MVHAEAQRDAEAQRWWVWRGGQGLHCNDHARFGVVYMPIALKCLW